MTWRLAVDQGTCIGSGLCAATAPQHFRVVDGVSHPLAELTEPDDAVLDAAESCPVEAILVRNAATAELLAPLP